MISYSVHVWCGAGSTAPLQHDELKLKLKLARVVAELKFKLQVPTAAPNTSSAYILKQVRASLYLSLSLSYFAVRFT